MFYCLSVYTVTPHNVYKYLIYYAYETIYHQKNLSHATLIRYINFRENMNTLAKNILAGREQGRTFALCSTGR